MKDSASAFRFHPLIFVMTIFPLWDGFHLAVDRVTTSQELML